MPYDKSAHTAYMRESRRRRRIAASSFSQSDPSSDPLLAFTDRHAWLPYTIAFVFAVAFFLFLHRFGLPSDLQSPPTQ